MNKIGLYGKVYFVVLSIAVAMFMAAVDRSFVIDNDNYVRYFSDEPALVKTTVKLNDSAINNVTVIPSR